MKLLLITINFSIVFFSGCATTPTKNPIEETGRRAGISIYKNVESKAYQGIDRKIGEVTSGVVNGVLGY